MTVLHNVLRRAAVGTGALAFAALIATAGARADETCMSPYMAKITGQEDYLYVWTLGVEGMGDGSDKMVTVDARPGSPTYGKVIDSVSVGGRHEAHHGGFTDDRRQFWVGGLDTSKIFVFDVASDPAKPKLVKTIDDFVKASGGVVGPIARETVETVGLPPQPDLGRYEMTLDPDDLYRFKTPSLRNVALTAPYMHDGSLRTLDDVVRFYDGGGVAHPGLDPLIRPLGLAEDEIAALVAFLEALTGDGVVALVADARSAPVGN